MEKPTWANKVKYLGTVQDTKLTFTAHVNKLISKGKLVIRTLAILH